MGREMKRAGKEKKRLFCWLMAIVVLVWTLPVIPSAVLAEVEGTADNPYVDSSNLNGGEAGPEGQFPRYPAPGGVNLDKQAYWVEDNVAKVELTVQGQPVNRAVDVVMVLDASTSMNGSLGDLKDAAKEFVEIIFAPNPDGSPSIHRVGLVYFNSKAYKPIGDSMFTVTSKAALISKIEAINTAIYTNYTEALTGGKSVLDARTTKNPAYMLFMSDGVPNPPASSGRAIDTTGMVVYGVGFESSRTNPLASFEYYIKNVSVDKGFPGHADNPGFKGDYVRAADGSGLLNAFASIAHHIKLAGTEALVTDPMNSEVFDVLIGHGDYPNPAVNRGTVTCSAIGGSDTFSWNLGNITNETATLTYYVQIKPGKIGTFPVNGEAFVYYKNLNDVYAKKYFRIPELANPGGQFRYVNYLADDNGDPISSFDTGAVIQLGDIESKGVWEDGYVLNSEGEKMLDLNHRYTHTANQFVLIKSRWCELYGSVTDYDFTPTGAERIKTVYIAYKAVRDQDMADVVTEYYLGEVSGAPGTIVQEGKFPVGTPFKEIEGSIMRDSTQPGYPLAVYSGYEKKGAFAENYEGFTVSGDADKNIIRVVHKEVSSGETVKLTVKKRVLDEKQRIATDDKEKFRITVAGVDNDYLTGFDLGVDGEKTLKLPEKGEYSVTEAAKAGYEFGALLNEKGLSKRVVDITGDDEFVIVINNVAGAPDVAAGLISVTKYVLEDGDITGVDETNLFPINVKGKLDPGDGLGGFSASEAEPAMADFDVEDMKAGAEFLAADEKADNETLGADMGGESPVTEMKAEGGIGGEEASAVGGITGTDVRADAEYVAADEAGSETTDIFKAQAEEENFTLFDENDYNVTKNVHQGGTVEFNAGAGVFEISEILDDKAGYKLLGVVRKTDDRTEFMEGQSVTLNPSASRGEAFVVFNLYDGNGGNDGNGNGGDGNGNGGDGNGNGGDGNGNGGDGNGNGGDGNGNGGDGNGNGGDGNGNGGDGNGNGGGDNGGEEENVVVSADHVVTLRVEPSEAGRAALSSESDSISASNGTGATLKLKAGRSISYSASANSGRRFVGWRVSGVNLQTNSATGSFTMPEGDVELTALFEMLGSGGGNNPAPDTEKPPSETGRVEDGDGDGDGPATGGTDGSATPPSGGETVGQTPPTQPPGGSGGGGGGAAGAPPAAPTAAPPQGAGQGTAGLGVTPTVPVPVIPALVAPATESTAPVQEPEEEIDAAGPPLADYEALRAETLQTLKDVGVPMAKLGGMEIPLFGPPGYPVWALLNLMLAVAGMLLCLIRLFRRRDDKEEAQTESKQNKDEQDDNENRKRLFKWITVIMGPVGVIAFVLTENMNNLMVIVDMYTPVMVILFAVGLIAYRLSKRESEETEEEEVTAVV